ncbi:MAG: hypothetical protein WCY86_02215, partial [Spirosomataceae bacterium]
NSLILQIGGSLGIALSGVFYQFLRQYYSLKQGRDLADHLALKGSFVIAAIMILAAWIPAWKLPQTGGRRRNAQELPQ